MLNQAKHSESTVSITESLYYEWLCLVLDGIYSCCGGNHLTPFSSTDFSKAAEKDHELYLKMITYNRVICAIRVTIERAFGQLVRRFGILYLDSLFCILYLETY
jgi:hypothetical protein